MNKKIVLRKMNCKKNNRDDIKIIFNLRVDNNDYNLWYKVRFHECDINYELPESSDSIIVTLLLFAMIYGYDFYSEYPMSEKLYYNILYNIIPQIKKCNPKVHDISINVPLMKHNYGGNYVATGISCGIDSLTTIYEYSELCTLDDYKLTHLVYFKTGAHDGQIGKFDREIENKLFSSQLENAKKYCKRNSFPLIVVDSNLNEFLSNVFGFTAYDRTHTLRNCGTMLLFQKIFSKYYYSDTYGLNDFVLDVNSDMAHYEKWLLPLLSTESIDFYSSNKGMSRFEKTKLLTDYHASYDNLLVCWHEAHNCGLCDKCIRTMVALDMLGKLDLYNKSFDINKYREHRKKYITRVIALRKNDAFFADLYYHMDFKTRLSISPVYYLIYKFEAFIRFLKKILKKVILKHKKF